MNKNNLQAHYATNNIFVFVILSSSFCILFFPIHVLITVHGFVSLKVYDILGREVRTLVNEKQSKGVHQIKFDASKYASGIYFYQLKTSAGIQQRKMLLLK